jgi:hypothetical protein
MFGSHAGLCLGRLVDGVYHFAQSWLGELTPPHIGQRHQYIAVADVWTVTADDVYWRYGRDQRIRGLRLIERPDQFARKIFGSTQGAEEVPAEQWRLGRIRAKETR